MSEKKTPRANASADANTTLPAQPNAHNDITDAELAEVTGGTEYAMVGGISGGLCG